MSINNSKLKVSNNEELIDNDRIIRYCIACI